MKILKFKNIQFLLMMLMSVSFLLTSCDKNTIIEEDAIEVSQQNVIEETTSYSEMMSLYEKMEQEGYEPYTITNERIIEPTNEISERGCSPCYPWLSEIYEHNVGGPNDRLFTVNGGRHYPCSYELTWDASFGVTINWTNGGFAYMSFPGSGFYGVCVELNSSDGSTNCVVEECDIIQIP